MGFSLMIDIFFGVFDASEFEFGKRGDREFDAEEKLVKSN